MCSLLMRFWSTFGNMNKAYDHVNWEFLFAFVVNGRWSKPFVPSHGLRQGDPLSPYLFILVAQAFSDGLEEFAANNVCRGISVSSCSPHISHLLFACR